MKAILTRILIAVILLTTIAGVPTLAEGERETISVGSAFVFRDGFFDEDVVKVLKDALNIEIKYTFYDADKFSLMLASNDLQLGVLNDMDSVYWFQSLLTIWKTLGWNAIIYIAAITGIDQQLYEAATVDGAGKFRCALHITIPSLMPTFIVLMLLCVSNFINVGMEQYYVFKNTFVYDRIEVLDVYTYRVGLQLYDYSYATAIGIFKSTISVIMLFIANTVAKLVRGQGIV